MPGLSHTIITSGAIASCGFGLVQRSPVDPDKPLMSFDIALTLVPAMLFGVSFVSFWVFCSDVRQPSQCAVHTTPCLVSKRTGPRDCDPSWQQSCQDRGRRRAAASCAAGCPRGAGHPGVAADGAADGAAGVRGQQDAGQGAEAVPEGEEQRADNATAGSPVRLCLPYLPYVHSLQCVFPS